MTLDGIFSQLENISKLLENKQGKVEKIKVEFDNELGISKDDHDKVVSLLDEFEDSEETMKFYEKKILDVSSSIEEFNRAIIKLKGEIASGSFTPTEKAEKEFELQELNNLKKNYENSNRRLEESDRKLKKRGIDDVSKALKSKKEMEAGMTSILKKGGLSKTISNVRGNVGFAIAQKLVEAIEFGIDKITEYAKVEFENLIRTMDASTTVTLNQMKAGLDSAKDSASGAYSSQQLFVQSQLSMMDAVNQSTLANVKLANTWTNWIPIIGHLNKQEEMFLEMQQTIAKHSLENAEKIIQQTQEYSRLTDEYLKKQDLAVHKYQTINGLTIDQTQIFEKRMLANGEAFAKFNKTIEDALELQNKFAEQSSRAINFSDSDFTKSFGVGRLVGEDNLTQFQSMMNIFNSSVSSSADLMYDMYNDANKMGISQQRLTKNVLGNLKLANKYDFKNGTRGFIEMAKWAESARVSLNSIASAIEKVQSGGLEGVLKQSAGLQVLGGGFAMGSDPLAMMFESFSDPQSYAKRIQQMLKGYGSFNKQTGETTFSGLENYMMRTASEQLGIPVEELKDMARGSRQKEYVKAQMGATTLSKKNQEAIANKAQYNQETKRWYVNTLNGGIMDVADVTEENIKNVLSGNKEENAEKYAQGTFAATEEIERTTKGIYSMLGKLGFEDFINFIEETNEQTRNAFLKNIEDVTSSISTVRNESLKSQSEMLENLGILNKKTNEAFETVHNFNEKLIEDYKRLKEEVSDNLSKREKNIEKTSKDQEYYIDKYRNASTIFTRAAYASHLKEGNKLIENGNRHRPWSSEDFSGFLAFFKNLFDDEGEKYIEEYKRTLPFKIKENQLIRKSIETGMNDGIIASNNKPIISQASNITKINDGLVQSNPKDVAIFAKEGGVIGNFLDNLYSDVHSVMGGSMSMDSVKVEISGSLDLSSGGQSVNIINELQNNPVLRRSLTKMLSEQISSAMNGGRSTANTTIGGVY